MKDVILEILKEGTYFIPGKLCGCDLFRLLKRIKPYTCLPKDCLTCKGSYLLKEQLRLLRYE